MVIGCPQYKRIPAEGMVRIDVSPTERLENQSASVVCFITKAVNNRWLDMGILEVSGVGRPLNGNKADPVYLLNFKAIPCGTQVAFCDLVTGQYSTRVTKTFEVTGCN